MRSGCYFSDPQVCEGDIWTCLTCEEEFCWAHWHRTSRGECVECSACERERLESKADERVRKFDHHVLRVEIFTEREVKDPIALLAELAVRGTEREYPRSGTLSDEDGTLVARIRVVESERISPQALALHMRSVELSPEFFGVDADGDEIED